MIFFEACSQDPLAHSIAEDFDKANPNQKMWILFILFTFYYLLYTFIILFYDAAFFCCSVLLSLCCVCALCCLTPA